MMDRSTLWDALSHIVNCFNWKKFTAPEKISLDAESDEIDSPSIYECDDDILQTPLLSHCQYEVFSSKPGFDWRYFLDQNPRIYRLYETLFPNSSEPWVQVTEIESDIYLGGIPNPINDPCERSNMDKTQAPHTILSEIGCKTIISFSDYEVWWNYGEDITFTHFVIIDRADKLISGCFDLVIQRIRDARKRGDKIFIHCHMGYSRSVTVLIAFYLVHGLPGEQTPTLYNVCRFIQAKRPFVCPNIGFFAQLVDFEERLKLKDRQTRI